VLDDAFQHLKVKRDLDIVCVDATNPFGNKRLLPAGILREPLRNLYRADAIVITRANLIDETQLAELKSEISSFNPKAKIFASQNKIVNQIDLKEFLINEKKMPESKQRTAHISQSATYLAFCGLGNPENFFRQLELEKFKVLVSKAFSDHYFYLQKDIDELVETARSKGAEFLLTTAKDAVKLSNLKFDLPCLVAESEMIFDCEKDLRELIEKAGN
jgi:tetraacyldisaccharide 4'-kinase